MDQHIDATCHHTVANAQKYPKFQMFWLLRSKERPQLYGVCRDASQNTNVSPQSQQTRTIMAASPASPCDRYNILLLLSRSEIDDLHIRRVGNRLQESSVEFHSYGVTWKNLVE